MKKKSPRKLNKTEKEIVVNILEKNKRAFLKSQLSQTFLESLRERQPIIMLTVSDLLDPNKNREVKTMLLQMKYELKDRALKLMKKFNKPGVIPEPYKQHLESIINDSFFETFNKFFEEIRCKIRTVSERD